MNLSNAREIALCSLASGFCSVGTAATLNAFECASQEPHTPAVPLADRAGANKHFSIVNFKHNSNYDL